MKIKLNIEAFGFKRGQEIEVSDSVGARLIKDGDAVEVKTEPRKAKRAKPENKALSAEG